MKKLKIKLLEDRILIQRIVQAKRDSGIILPDTIEAKGLQKGKVISVGEGKILDNGDILEPRVKVGDIVHFSSDYSAEEFKGGEQGDLLVIRESNVVGIIE